MTETAAHTILTDPDTPFTSSYLVSVTNCIGKMTNIPLDLVRSIVEEVGVERDVGFLLWFFYEMRDYRITRKIAAGETEESMMELTRTVAQILARAPSTARLDVIRLVSGVHWARELWGWVRHYTEA